jgi:hypothetical protein
MSCSVISSLHFHSCFHPQFALDAPAHFRCACVACLFLFALVGFTALECYGPCKVTRRDLEGDCQSIFGPLAASGVCYLVMLSQRDMSFITNLKGWRLIEVMCTRNLDA